LAFLSCAHELATCKTPRLLNQRGAYIKFEVNFEQAKRFKI
jgi:hypothetical protein